MIGLPVGVQVWLAADATDMRKGFDGLAAQVQTVLARDPLYGHVFAFRGRRGDLVKLLWWDGEGWTHSVFLSPFCRSLMWFEVPGDLRGAPLKKLR